MLKFPLTQFMRIPILQYCNQNNKLVMHGKPSKQFHKARASNEWSKQVFSNCKQICLCLQISHSIFYIIHKNLQIIWKWYMMLFNWILKKDIYLIQLRRCKKFHKAKPQSKNNTMKIIQLNNPTYFFGNFQKN